jgi:hypothetical protein
VAEKIKKPNSFACLGQIKLSLEIYPMIGLQKNVPFYYLWKFGSGSL